MQTRDNNNTGAGVRIVMPSAGLHWISIVALVGSLALCALWTGCTQDIQTKGDDPDPGINDNSSDSFSEQASFRGELELDVPLIGSFDESSHHAYDLVVGPSAVVDISLRGEDDSGLDTVLRVYGPRDADGKLPESKIAYDDDGGEGYASRIDYFAFPEPGAYAVLVSTYAGRSAPGRRYRLYVECKVDSCSPEVEEPRVINIEIDRIGEALELMPEAMERINAVYAQVGIELVFNYDTVIDAEGFEFSFDWGEFSDVYFDHYAHRGEPGWSYVVISGIPLQGSMGGWGRIDGDMCVLSSNWKNYSGERALAEQVYIFLHEFGHNRGLFHAGFDPDNPHDYSNCVMPAGSGRDRSPEVMPATQYCDSCLEHINPDKVRSAFP